MQNPRQTRISGVFVSIDVPPIPIDSDYTSGYRTGYGIVRTLRKDADDTDRSRLQKRICQA